MSHAVKKLLPEQPCEPGEHVPAIVHRSGGKDAVYWNTCGKCGREIHRSHAEPMWLTGEQSDALIDTLANEVADKVMHRVNKRLADRLASEQALPLRLFWLSFADPARPEGQQFLGVAIVEARGVATATQEARSRGCNPGGEVLCAELGEAARLMFGPYLNRLLTREELLAAGLV